jgi:uncharacterized protein with von Willebrand factor type A (vWA) domain
LEEYAVKVEAQRVATDELKSNTSKLFPLPFFRPGNWFSRILREMNPDSELNNAPALNVVEQMYNAADIMRIDDEYMIFRRFDRLNAFNLLLLQQQLKRLENTMEAILKENNEHDMQSLSIDLRNTLREYSE